MSAAHKARTRKQERKQQREAVKHAVRTFFRVLHDIDLSSATYTRYGGRTTEYGKFLGASVTHMAKQYR